MCLIQSRAAGIQEREYAPSVPGRGERATGTLARKTGILMASLETHIFIKSEGRNTKSEMGLKPTGKKPTLPAGRTTETDSLNERPPPWTVRIDIKADCRSLSS
jgi:hypothetical protein